MWIPGLKGLMMVLITMMAITQSSLFRDMQRHHYKV